MSKAEENIAAIAGKAAAAALATVLPHDATGAIIAAATAGGLEAMERLSGAGIVALFRSPADHRLAAEWACSTAKELDGEKERLAGKIDQILDAAEDRAAATSNVINLYLDWQRARAKASDPKKARILMAAFVNAFDPEAYREGMNAALLRTIATLDYGDLFFLKSLRPVKGGMDRDAARRFDPSVSQGSNPLVAQEGSMAVWHAERLLEARLITVRRASDRSFNAFMASQTAVGRRLLTLIGEEAFREAEDI